MRVVRIRSMKDIRAWAKKTERRIEKDGDTQKFVLITADNRSHSMHRPRFRRACTVMMESEGYNDT